MATVTTANPSPVPTTANNTPATNTNDTTKPKPNDTAMDVDDDNDDDHTNTATNDSHPTTATTAAAAAAPSAVDPSAPAASFAPGHSSLSSPTGSSLAASASDEPAASVVYIPGGVLPQLTRYVHRLLDIRIAARYLTTRSKEVLTRQVWGGADAHYTDDSDAVCLLVHSGLQIVRANPPADVSGNGGVVLTVRVVEAREQYVAAERNGLKSRSWISKYHRLSLQVVSCDVTDNINATRSKASAPASGTATASTTPSTSTAAVVVAAAAPAPASSSATAAAGAASSAGAAGKKDKKELRQLKMLVSDRPYSSGAVSSGHIARLRAAKRKYIPECSMQFGDDELGPWLHYSLWAVSDRAVDEASWCTERLRSHVIRLEGRDGRFEIRREPRKGEKKGHTIGPHSFNTQNNLGTPNHTASLPFAAILALKPQPAEFDTYYWAAVHVLNSAKERKNSGIEVQLTGLDWSEIEWGTDGVRVRGREYKIDRVRWEVPQ